MTEQATELASALQEERDRSAGPLTDTGNAKDDTVVGPREKTDQSFQAFKEATAEIDGSDRVMAGVQSTVLDITRQLTAIKDIRERAYENPASVAQTVNSYNQLIESLLSLSQDMAQATNNSEMIQSTRALASFSTAKEYASIQRAIISAGLARKGGPELSESDRLYGKTAAESESASLGSFSQIYGEERAAELHQAARRRRRQHHAGRQVPRPRAEQPRRHQEREPLVPGLVRPGQLQDRRDGQDRDDAAHRNGAAGPGVALRGAARRLHQRRR